VNLNFDNLQEAGSSSEQDGYIGIDDEPYFQNPGMQLLAGDEMNAAMANFMKIHMPQPENEDSSPQQQ
jgi:hypothetical protein